MIYVVLSFVGFIIDIILRKIISIFNVLTLTQYEHLGSVGSVISIMLQSVISSLNHYRLEGFVAGSGALLLWSECCRTSLETSWQIQMSCLVTAYLNTSPEPSLLLLKSPYLVKSFSPSWLIALSRCREIEKHMQIIVF